MTDLIGPIIAVIALIAVGIGSGWVFSLALKGITTKATTKKRRKKMNNKTRIVLLGQDFSEQLALLREDHFQHILNLNDKISELKVALDSRTQFEWGKKKIPVFPTISREETIKRDVAPMLKLLLKKLNFTLTDTEAKTTIEPDLGIDPKNSKK